MAASDAPLQQLHRQAQAALADGRAREAHQHCLQILQSDPQFADAWFLCGVIAAQNGLLSKAVEIFHKALALCGDNAEYEAELGKTLVSLNRYGEALQAAQRAWSQKPQDLPTLNTLGVVFSHTGEHDRALACFEQAATLLESQFTQRRQPNPTWCADFYFNHANSLQFAGQLGAAEATFERAIACAPKLFKAHSALASLRRVSHQDNHLQRLEQLRPHVGSASDQLHLGHALASEQEKLGLFKESLQSLQWAKQNHAQQVEYKWQEDSEFFDCMPTLFNAELYSGPATGCNSSEPIFIVGMPRTGTTLTEQILASHSRVFAAGELQNLGLLVQQMTDTPSGSKLDAHTLKRALDLDPAELGQRYLESTRPRTGHSDYFIDKLPLNFFYLGLIKRALPNAKLVCLLRNPMDSCLSNYRQQFATTFRSYHYSLDLLDCGRYYIAFRRLMQHWQSVLPGGVIELQYEELVSNPETVSRSLLSNCGLDWEPQCLEFQNSTRAVATASSAQVRSGIYQTSVDRWRNYGDALKPLQALLESAGFGEEGIAPL
jgi:tetratricopeptide (TPR) repeat protein